VGLLKDQGLLEADNHQWDWKESSMQGPGKVQHAFITMRWSLNSALRV
jgi:hypothetical protein